MLIANQDVTSDRRRVLTLRHLAPSVLAPSGHGPLRPVRPDCGWCSSITSWLPLIYDSCVPTASGPALLRSDCVGSMTRPPGCRFLLSERQGFAHLEISRPNVFTPCRPRPDPTIPISAFLTPAHFFLILRPIYAASWSDRDSIWRRVFIRTHRVLRLMPSWSYT